MELNAKKVVKTILAFALLVLLVEIVILKFHLVIQTHALQMACVVLSIRHFIRVIVFFLIQEITVKKKKRYVTILTVAKAHVMQVILIF